MQTNKIKNNLLQHLAPFDLFLGFQQIMLNLKMMVHVMYKQLQEKGALLKEIVISLVMRLYLMMRLKTIAKQMHLEEQKVNFMSLGIMIKHLMLLKRQVLTWYSGLKIG